MISWETKVARRHLNDSQSAEIVEVLREMGGSFKREGYMYTYGRFRLRFDRKQQNSVKQLSFNKKSFLKKCWNKKLLTKTMANSFLKNEGEIKIFSDKEILNEFISSRSTLQKNKIKS